MDITFNEALEAYERITLNRESDNDVREARILLQDAQEKLDAAVRPYQEMLNVYGGIIENHVINNLRESIKQGHVRVTYYGPRRNTSWKSIAEALDAPNELIEEHTSYSSPRAKIKVELNGG